jgi:hypothetical protein
VLRGGIVRIALALLPATALAQDPRGPAGSPEDVRREIMAVEERIGQANFACDYAFFAKVEASEFIFTDPSGGLTTRAQDLAGEKDCRPSNGTYVLAEVRITTLGSVVVFNALATTTRVKAGGESVARRQRFTDVLVWRDGRWQLVAGHSSGVR